ncbi:ABC transporter substrate-binding protein [Pseudomonas sp. 5P_3.1_Bac2]|uniref:ABC transporter substrate-binding protein n=1 Tax=Pseudomonas sp. 5P_3.1_Bac2 TaxID=2971617 RepID=UPI0021C65AF2|nr:ABC transporter substrate-binding protein [Pseudomonas sp. 5P_3.1_Bac2]MCU1717014.1 ABC transporter substrate-binding protein [Pseudomonas sp. 5P_3.1_Bac2]
MAAIFALWAQISFASPQSHVVTPKPAAKVVFLSPGYSDEEFWLSYIDFMQAAADDLDMQLEVVHGERSSELLLSEARKILTSKEQPDYLLFVNELSVAPELLRIYADSSIKLFSLHSTLTDDQQDIIGGTRGRYSNWIGSLVANDEQAGYIAAKALISELQGQPASLLAFAGVRNTPNSSLRAKGLKRALHEHPEIKLQQMVYGEWSRQRAYEQAKLLLPRYPNVRLVWSANDQMAFGVMDAAQEQGKVPGKDLLLSGINNSQEVFQARLDGRLSVLVGGHFTLGGWAMVMLHDYHKGKDFELRGGKDRLDPLFTVLNPEQVRRLQQRLNRPGYGLDFRQFSSVYHEDMQNYNFSLQPLLD